VAMAIDQARESKRPGLTVRCGAGQRCAADHDVIIIHARVPRKAANRRGTTGLD